MISPRRADELDLAQSRKKNLAAAGAVGAPRDGFSMRRLPQLGPRPRIKAPERGLQLSNFLVIQFDRRQARMAFGRALPGLQLGASMPSVRIWSRPPGGQPIQGRERRRIGQRAGPGVHGMADPAIALGDRLAPKRLRRPQRLGFGEAWAAMPTTKMATSPAPIVLAPLTADHRSPAPTGLRSRRAPCGRRCC